MRKFLWEFEHASCSLHAELRREAKTQRNFCSSLCSEELRLILLQSGGARKLQTNFDELEGLRKQAASLRPQTGSKIPGLETKKSQFTVRSRARNQKVTSFSGSEPKSRSDSPRRFSATKKVTSHARFAGPAASGTS